MIIPTAHTTAEWSRLAQDAYNRGHNDIGHRYSMAAAVYTRSCPTDVYDTLQRNYRLWLNWGFGPDGFVVPD
jgi:hypothetical protein